MKIFSKIYIWLLLIFLYAPVFLMAIYSFNASKSRIIWAGFSFKWYLKLFQNKVILTALWNTVLVAIIASSAAIIFGTIAAFGIMNSKKFARNIILKVTNFPMINPEIVTGISLMVLFVFLYNQTGYLKPGLFTLILSHITFCLPYVILSIIPKLKQIDKNLYEAAIDLGCNPLQAFLTVILPEIIPSIVSGFMMSFTMSISDFVISYFTSGNLQTLPIIICAMTRKLVSPEINSLFTILFAVILLISVNFSKSNKNSEMVKQK